MDNYKFKEKVKQNWVLRTAFYFFNSFKSTYFDPFSYIKNLSWYLADIFRYTQQKKNDKARINFNNFYPQLLDRTKTTPVEATYFLQDAWAARKIFKLQPDIHYDIASSLKTISIVAQNIPTRFVDIRPPEIEVEGLEYIEGSILELPLKDGSIKSLSSLCVIEHIGLGRYGDDLDSFGSEKAAEELQRVVAKKGDLFVSVPVAEKNELYFNAHRTFTSEYLISLFDKCRLIEERYVYGEKIYKNYDKKKGFGVGLFHFKKT